MAKRRIDEVDVRGQRVLIRVDFNVPIEQGRIVDDRRIRTATPTIQSVLQRNGRCILLSHLGRPKGSGFEPALSLEPCAARLTELLGQTCRGPVIFPSHDCVDGAAVAAVNMLADGEALLLENLRFHEEEKKGDEQFAQRLAAMGDIFCNDAFGTCHRTDASMVALPQAMGYKPKVCGFLVDREIRYLKEALETPTRPFVVVLGGAKVADKLGAIENLLAGADAILIGGAMAYTFLEARGEDVGDSRVEPDKLEEARRIMRDAQAARCTIHLPADHVVAARFDENEPGKVVSGQIPAGRMGLDIGPATRSTYEQVLREAGTIVWNGPMGVFEWKEFEAGTRHIAQAIAAVTERTGAVSVVGGGDTAAAVDRFGLAERFSHVSTGGGASLEMLEGREFRSVQLLDDAEKLSASVSGS